MASSGMDYRELLRGCEVFNNKVDPRDATYNAARFMVDHFWKEPSKVADGLGVLLLTWNNAFYRYGGFDFDELEKCIRNLEGILEEYRNRDIFGLVEEDGERMEEVFKAFLNALKLSRNGKTLRSPVATAKALHAIAPRFFSLWDDNISYAYGCYWDLSTRSPPLYVRFQKNILQMAKAIVESYMREHSVNFSNAIEAICALYPQRERKYWLLKLIDEYNFSKYTKKLIDP